MTRGDRLGLSLTVLIAMGTLGQIWCLIQRAQDLDPTEPPLNLAALEGVTQRALFSGNLSVADQLVLPQSDYKLVGISRSGAKRLAVFENGNAQTSIVTENARLGDWTLIKIEPRYVLMKRGQDVVKIELNGLKKGNE